MILGIYIFLLTIHIVSSQEGFYPDRQCKFKYNVRFGQKIAIYNPEWPHKYKLGQKCRWIFECPVKYNCLLFCYDMSLPESTKCFKDHILVSRVGDTYLKDPEYYCGSSVFTSKSLERKLTIGFKASRTGRGGTFRCEVSSVWGHNAYYKS